MNEFRVGQTVESKMKKDKLGTVLSVADDMLEIRWDKELKSVYVSPTRVWPKTVNPTTELSFFDKATSEFKRGDYLEVDSKAFGVIRGAALTDMTTFGYATFELLGDNGNYYALNSNWDKFTVLFRADIARGINPEY